MNHKRKEEMSAKDWNLFALAGKDCVLFYRGAILLEGLIVVQQGEKMAEYYGLRRTLITVHCTCYGKKVNDKNRRIKGPSIKIIFEQNFYCRGCYMFRPVQKPSSGTS
jgi:hypothetical protein